MIALLSAVCIVSRIALQFLPNIKPVTTVIILLAVYMGIAASVEAAVVITLVSDMLLGLGTWTPFQILAWTVIAVLSGVLAGSLRKLPLVLLSLYAAFCGFLFGFVVSWERLLFVNFQGFIVYYLAGLSFDLLHAAGNFAFCLVFAVPLRRIFEREGLITEL